jgi:hypothetical protein
VSGDVCDDATTCSDCNAENSCVWCSDTNSCLQVDSNGETEIYCGEVDETCQQGECAALESCTSCLNSENDTGDANCGWCSNGAYCFSASADENDECDLSNFYHIDGDNEDCPAEEEAESQEADSTNENEGTPVDATIEVESEEYDDDEILELQEDLEALRNEEDALVAQIEIIDEQIAENNQMMADATALESPEIALEDNTACIAEEADKKHQEETDELYAHIDSGTSEVINEVNGMD